MPAGDDAERSDEEERRFEPAGDDAERSDEEERCKLIVTVNETEVEVDEQMTVAALLRSLGYPERGIAVALDQAVLPRSRWATNFSELPGPVRLEVVTAVQGG